MYKRQIIDSAKRLANIVVNMAKLMESEEWEPPLARQHVSPGELVESAVGQVQPFVEMRGQYLHTDISEGLPVVDVEPPLIVDALVNLLMNAVKFTRDGGSITVEARPGAKEGFVDIAVSDTGIGIPPEELPHIFRRFFGTFDTSHHTSGEYEFGRRGMGLGLPVVRRFAEMHGGEVNVESEVGVGSTFTISLPAVKE